MLTGTAWLNFTHDAWNRLVRIERSSGGLQTPVPLAEFEYNGLHQRILKRVDTSPPGTPGTGGSGTLNQQHRFYFTGA